MTEPASNYMPSQLRLRYRTQAVRVWAITLGVILIWVSIIVATPILHSSGASQFSSPIYYFFGYICHQIPERSLHLAEHAMAVCSRCFGVYFGLLAGILGYPLWRSIDETEPIPRFWLFLSLVPITIDWSLTVFGIWENTHASRFLTGTILGFACAVFIVPALVEVAGHVSMKRRRT